MKKILGIIGSERKLGNCELIIKEVSLNIKTPHTLELIRLTNFNVLPCKGCYSCLFKGQKCILGDDSDKIISSIASADALILAAPTYFLASHSSLKRFIDKGLSFYPYAKKLWGKPSVGLAIAGIKEREGSCLLGIENFLKFVLSDIKQTHVIYGALPGEVLLGNKNKTITKSIAHALFSSSTKKQEPHCNLCGGTTFQFLGKDKVRCMLCSNSGTIQIRQNKICVQVEKKGPQFFLTKNDAEEHKNWLIGMKSKFSLNSEILKEVTKIYQNSGQWIKSSTDTRS